MKDDLYSSFKRLDNFSLTNISELFSNYLTVQYDISAQYLATKKHPAKAEAQRIGVLKQETKGYIKQFKVMQYKYEALVNLFPELTNYIDDFSIIRELNQFTDVEEVIETYDKVRDFLPKEEYETLKENERNQRALDCYNRKKKSNWQIGRDYEMYCAYQYRLMNCDIEQTGIEKKFKDLGRDLIIHKPDGSTHIVQCKYWSSAKEIHENSIAQLYGTTVMYKIENNLDKTHVVKPVFITNIKLSEVAQHFANELGVLVVQDFPLGKYPQIKCNINNGNKIYHLPFDQQYDSAHIKLDGEFYAFTVKEAIEKGFRRAFRYYGI
ncbi:MAG: restriction endonuclease [Atribacterota bacterium]|nr:restriction endonuclease [Atribacterota bacterium]